MAMSGRPKKSISQLKKKVQCGLHKNFSPPLMRPFKFSKVEYPQPHIERGKSILEQHPEVRGLFGPTPSSVLWIAALVALQFTVAIALRQAPWWMVLGLAWLVGGFIEHGLFTLIHDCAHNLVFKKPFWNKVCGIVGNLPGVFPSAVAFRNYHLMHHRHMGEMGWDADLAGPKEAAWVGNDPFKKALTLAFYFVNMGFIRPLRIGKVKVWEPWAWVNGLFTIGLALLIYYYFGWASLAYLFFSVMAGTGLHPVGGRWIQEHIVFKEGQETYSYYGPLNALAFNVGYHTEHHDFKNIPWSRLPRLREIAPEFYNHRYFHTSWSKVLIRFICDPELSFFGRIERSDEPRKATHLITTKYTDSLNQNHKYGLF